MEGIRTVRSLAGIQVALVACGFESRALLHYWPGTSLSPTQVTIHGRVGQVVGPAACKAAAFGRCRFDSCLSHFLWPGTSNW